MAKNKVDQKTRVVYVGRLPHGFYEEEMRRYFKQFGTIEKLRISRNRKTGASKHYAFIQFEDSEVAKIVAETMDNYLLYGRLLQCKLVDKVHPKTFKNSNRKFVEIPTKAINKSHKNRFRIGKEWLVSTAKLAKKDERRRANITSLLEENGVDFDFPKSTIADQFQVAKSSIVSA